MDFFSNYTPNRFVTVLNYVHIILLNRLNILHSPIIILPYVTENVQYLWHQNTLSHELAKFVKTHQI